MIVWYVQVVLKQPHGDIAPLLGCVPASTGSMEMVNRGPQVVKPSLPITVWPRFGEWFQIQRGIWEFIEREWDSKYPCGWTGVWLLGRTLAGPAWISTKRQAGMRTSQWVAAWRADGLGCMLPLGRWHYYRNPPALWHHSKNELAKINFFYSKKRMRGRNPDMIELKFPLTGQMEGL